MSYLWIFLLAGLAIGAKAQELDLSDALDFGDEPTKAPPPKIPDDPKKPSGGDLDLFDALGPDPKDPPKDPAVPPKDPSAPGGGGLDLSDALGPDTEPKKPAVNPPKGGGTGGGTFGDSDLIDVLGGGGDYKPDKGKGGGAGGAGGAGGGGGGYNPSSDHDGGRGYDEGHKEAGSLDMTGILSGVGVAVVGAISSYFAYKKRQSCFNMGVIGGPPTWVTIVIPLVGMATPPVAMAALGAMAVAMGAAPEAAQGLEF